MRGASLKPNHRRIARTVGRIALNAITAGGVLTAALTTGVWIAHNPQQFNVSGDTLTVYSIAGAILALMAADSILGQLFQPLWDRLEDDDLAADVLEYLADNHAHALAISRAVGTAVGDIFPVLAELEAAGEITSYWAEPSEESKLRRRLYALAPQV
ncbi:PadR family transcriptional regulator [Streptomyces sp. NPDC048324]|uniref:PadR family transcriptional regulator n=1 Tax=Streptomyces sp. NPDC048324 TaxID=3157205 RepID=UPI003432CACD